MKTRFIEIAQFGEEFEKLKTFAKSFDHEISPIRNGRIMAFERNQRIFGYSEIFYVPVAFPAFHPKVTEPRGIIEVVDGFTASCQLNHGGDGFIAVPLAEERKTFPIEQIVNRGFKRWHRELYYLNNE